MLLRVQVYNHRERYALKQAYEICTLHYPVYTYITARVQTFYEHASSIPHGIPNVPNHSIVRVHELMLIIHHLC